MPSQGAGASSQGAPPSAGAVPYETGAFVAQPPPESDPLGSDPLRADSLGYGSDHQVGGEYRVAGSDRHLAVPDPQTPHPDSRTPDSRTPHSDPLAAHPLGADRAGAGSFDGPETGFFDSQALSAYEHASRSGSDQDGPAPFGDDSGSGRGRAGVTPPPDAFADDRPGGAVPGGAARTGPRPGEDALGPEGPDFDGPVTGAFDMPVTGMFERPEAGSFERSEADPSEHSETGRFERPEPGGFERPEAGASRDSGPFARSGGVGSGSDAFRRPEAGSRDQRDPQAGPYERDGLTSPDATQVLGIGAAHAVQGAGDALGPAGDLFQQGGAHHQNPGGAEPFGQSGTDPFGQVTGEPREGVGRPDEPVGAPNGGHPPAPGDIKVAGTPTAVSPTPAWADSNETFTDTGWAPEEFEDDSRRRKGRRRGGGGDGFDDENSGGGGRIRVALLSVAAVAVVLGGTVAGVKLMGASGEAECPGGKCTAVQGGTSSPPPTVATSEPAPAEEEEPTEEPEPSRTKTKTPRPTTSSPVAQPPRRTVAPPRPTPTKTRTNTPKPPERTTRPPRTPAPSEEPTGGLQNTGDPSTGTIESGGPIPTTGSTSGFGHNGGITGGGSAGPSVDVDYEVTERNGRTYTAGVSVLNSSAQQLNGITLSLPVTGRVLDVTGADWTQDGQLLIIDVAGLLSAGASKNLTISATGTGAQPQNCGLVGGDCSLT
ncbi:hypothetical protein [Nonomuraea longicatena]